MFTQRVQAKGSPKQIHLTSYFAVLQTKGDIQDFTKRLFEAEAERERKRLEELKAEFRRLEEEELQKLGQHVEEKQSIEREHELQKLKEEAALLEARLFVFHSTF